MNRWWNLQRSRQWWYLASHRWHGNTAAPCRQPGCQESTWCQGGCLSGATRVVWVILAAATNTQHQPHTQNQPPWLKKQLQATHAQHQHTDHDQHSTSAPHTESATLVKKSTSSYTRSAPTHRPWPSASQLCCSNKRLAWSPYSLLLNINTTLSKLAPFHTHTHICICYNY